MTLKAEVAALFLKHWDEVQRVYTRLGKATDKAKPSKAIVAGFSAALLAARYLQFCGLSRETGEAAFQVAWRMMEEAAAARAEPEPPMN